MGFSPFTPSSKKLRPNLLFFREKRRFRTHRGADSVSERLAGPRALWPSTLPGGCPVRLLLLRPSQLTVGCSQAQWHPVVSTGLAGPGGWGGAGLSMG